MSVLWRSQPDVAGYYVATSKYPPVSQDARKSLTGLEAGYCDVDRRSHQWEPEEVCGVQNMRCDARTKPGLSDHEISTSDRKFQDTKTHNRCRNAALHERRNISKKHTRTGPDACGGRGGCWSGCRPLVLSCLVPVAQAWRESSAYAPHRDAAGNNSSVQHPNKRALMVNRCCIQALNREALRSGRRAVAGTHNSFCKWPMSVRTSPPTGVTSCL